MRPWFIAFFLHGQASASIPRDPDGLVPLVQDRSRSQPSRNQLLYTTLINQLQQSVACNIKRFWQGVRLRTAVCAHLLRDKGVAVDLWKTSEERTRFAKKIAHNHNE